MADGAENEIFRNNDFIYIVPGAGFEPANLAASAPKADASSNFATPAQLLTF